MRTIRTFVAVPLPNDLAGPAADCIARTRQDGDGIRWVPEDNLHLTLKFLGEVENVDTPAVCQLVRRIANDVQPFDLQFRGCDALPSVEKARVLTIAVDDPSGQLKQMAMTMEDHFADLGFKREPRDYVPHLTLGRAKANSRRVPESVLSRWLQGNDDSLGEMTVRRVQVIGSFLEKRGPTYNVMDTVHL
ncbi:MAG: RNA 2',3'-cyclic phosphodiesterase [Planctomycetota bacterium]